MAVDIYGNVIMPEEDPGFYGPRPQPRGGGYGYAPYEEAAARSRLTWQQRLGAALSGLGAVRPGAGFGEAFLQGLGGASRNVYLAQTQAQNAAQEYAMRQMEMQRQRERDEIYKMAVEADIASKSRPEKPEKKEPWERTPEEQAAIIKFEADRVRAIEAAKPQKPQGGSVKAPAAPKPVAAKPSSGAEKTALAYYNRMKSAEDTIATLENKMAKLPLAGQYQLRYAPNVLQSSDQQVYRQAQRAFTEARLRKESGAAIPQGEYDTDAQTYFAQPGDKPETVRKKRAARQAVLNGLKFSAGKAYQEFYGEGSFNPDEARKKYGY